MKAHRAASASRKDPYVSSVSNDDLASQLAATPWNGGGESGLANDSPSNRVTESGQAAGGGPTITIEGNPIFFLNPTAYTDGGDTVLLADPSSSTLTGATVTISGGGLPGDMITSPDAPGYPGITASYDSATKTLTLAGVGTLGDYQGLLTFLLFSSTSSDPLNGGADPTRTLTYTVTDGVNTSSPVSATADIYPVNPSPPSGTTAFLVMSNSNNGDEEIFDIGSDKILAAYSLGALPAGWQLQGFGGFYDYLGHTQATDTMDMALRESSTGTMEFFAVNNNTIQSMI